eukprot:TRINITY_DN59366_c0_g1_i2.p1 TRINITY_DN59366_c0_g1~~TRINITY_DN59366_c0_g1_i2.p1  ORF type:complete len:210 (+),score=27.49 TRINITY_DN59366_c0_g1_i2:107-736(+)
MKWRAWVDCILISVTLFPRISLQEIVHNHTEHGEALLSVFLKDVPHVRNHPAEIAKLIAESPPEKQIHMLIINRNILAWLREQIAFFHQRGYYNIWVFDNASRFPKLLEFYESGPVAVFYAPANWGNLILNYAGIERLLQILQVPFVLTDPDIVPASTCPDDFVHEFLKMAEERAVSRIGPHLHDVSRSLISSLCGSAEAYGCRMSSPR